MRLLFYVGISGKEESTVFLVLYAQYFKMYFHNFSSVNYPTCPFC